jgi:hypothetical protein
LDLAILFSSGAATAQTIRQVDFKNSTYPLSGPLLGHDRLHWLDIPSAAHPGGKHIHLVNGNELTKSSSVSDPRKMSGECCSSGFVRMHYRWHEGRFEADGIREFRTLK